MKEIGDKSTSGAPSFVSVVSGGVAVGSGVGSGVASGAASSCAAGSWEASGSAKAVVMGNVRIISTAMIHANFFFKCGTSQSLYITTYIIHYRAFFV
ncbi:MAG: hypothetical protein DELT_03347 [Desulfovibrio sp.]